MLEFTGTATPLTDDDIAAVAYDLGIEPALISAIAEVESNGKGFLADKRPKILFEAHVFYRETDGQFGISNISAPRWDRSLYGKAGAHQYDRLAKAIRLNRTAALRSASWGRFQVMGFNHGACGFDDVEAFVAAMMTGERAHLAACIAYCESRDLLSALIDHDFETFTKGYNGSGQVAHYSKLLAEAYQQEAARWAENKPAPPVEPIPEEPETEPEPIEIPAKVLRSAIEAMQAATRTVQTVLRATGHYNGKVDGIYGPMTKAAIKEAQK